MKRSVVVAAMVVVLLLAAPAAWAKSTITVNPVGLLFGIASLEYETDLARLGNQTTLGVQGQFLNARSGNVTLRLSGVGGGIRYYPAGTAHDGFYVGGYGNYLVGTVSDGVDQVRISALGLSGAAGYKWIFNSGFVLDLGATYTLPMRATVSAGPETLADGVLPGAAGLGIGVGFAF